MEFRDWPLAFHITFGTYGTRLHGDERGTVDRRQNRYGDPIIGRDPDWERMDAKLLKFEPCVLSPGQRSFIEDVVPRICDRGGWTYHVSAAREDHVHNVLSTRNDGQVVRKLLKRWLGEALSERWPLAAGQTWWAECGSVKWVWTEAYFDEVMDYVLKQRTTAIP